MSAHPTYHLVPVDPTPEMVDAVNEMLKSADRVEAFWTGLRAYLAARPQRESTGDRK